MQVSKPHQKVSRQPVELQPIVPERAAPIEVQTAVKPVGFVAAASHAESLRAGAAPASRCPAAPGGTAVDWETAAIAPWAAACLSRFAAAAACACGCTRMMLAVQVGWSASVGQPGSYYTAEP